ncbi:MAG: response regulator transcription factor [Treponemataceae bacterium]
MLNKIRVLIAEDADEIRQYFKRIVSSEPDMEVVALASSGIAAVEAAKKHRPNIVLMDIQMENSTAGIQAIQEIKRWDPEVKSIILTIHNRDDLLYQAYAAGAMDYIVKTSKTEDILKSIRAAASNTLMVRPEIASKILGECKRVESQQGMVKDVLKVMMKITNMEFEIIKLSYDGYTYRQIAEQRNVEETTIRSEIHRILMKFEKRRMKDVICLLREINFFELFFDT